MAKTFKNRYDLIDWEIYDILSCYSDVLEKGVVLRSTFQNVFNYQSVPKYLSLILAM